MLRKNLPLLLLSLAAVALVLHALSYDFLCDDAYISFRYSENFARHGELNYNLGERVEGYTNFLWTFILGLLMVVGVSPEISSRVLGAFFGAVVLLLLYALSNLYRGGRGSVWNALAPILLSVSGTFVIWSSSGLETPMFTALLLGGMVLYVAEQSGRSGALFPASGLVFALAAMTRPEGVMVFALTGAHRLAANLLRERRLMPTRREVLWLAGFAVPFGAYFAWRWSYYGYPFPNTFYVKSQGAWLTARKWGVPYLVDFARESRLYILAPLLLFFRPERPLAGFVWSYFGVVVAIYSAYVMYVGGDFMANGRFLAPVMPLFAFFGQEALRELVERWPRPRLIFSRRRASTGEEAASLEDHPARFALVAAILVAGGTWSSVSLHRMNDQMTYYRPGLDTVSYLRRFASDDAAIGGWMREHLPADTLCALGGAGSMGYASRLPAFDAFGLVDEWIAHNVEAHRGGRPAHAKYTPIEYPLRRQVDLMCYFGDLHRDRIDPTPPKEDLLWRQRGYEWACMEVNGPRSRYYCCLKRIARDLGPHVRPVRELARR